MIPQLEQIQSTISSSIAVKRDVVPYMVFPLHYHPEYEIIFVEKSYGIRIMGNHIGNFYDNDLMFMSSNLPHVWRNDNEFYQNNENMLADVYVIHFKENALGEGFFKLPEFANVQKMFEHGQQGLLVKEKDRKEISELIKAVYNSSGIERINLFLKTLDALANLRDFELLASPGYVNSINYTDTDRINKVMDFIMKNYARDIHLHELSKLVNLSKTSFCRYFKLRTNKTYSEFLNEIRIAHACKLLISDNTTVTEVCYATGYNNMSHFNRQFKIYTGLTAKKYANKFLKNG